MSRSDQQAIRLSAAMLGGPWNSAAMIERTLPVVEGSRERLLSVVRETLQKFPDHRPRRRLLVAFLNQALQPEADFEESEEDDELQIGEYLQPTVFDCQRNRFAELAIPRWQTVRDLAEWLDLDDAGLNWFADQKGLERTLCDGPLRHYYYRWIQKRRSGFRLIESPKRHLKQIQRRLLAACLQRLPIHQNAHGFRRGRSAASYTAPHTNRQIVLRMDLQHFFPSLVPWRLTHLLMLAGYCEDVARMMTGLCTNVTPSAVWDSRTATDSDPQIRRMLQQPHFPQGAPTSPAIANLIAFRLDSRLTGLANWAGASYTRYADDLLFSGDEKFRHRVDRFRIYVAAVAMDEGFEVNHHKTRIMSQSVRQRATGIVLNQRQSICRKDCDQLKAILHNAVRHGPDKQNRSNHPDFRSHLLGRINYVAQFNPQRAAKLRAKFSAIQWE